VDGFIRELATYAKVQDHQGMVVKMGSGEVARITTLGQLPKTEQLKLSVIKSYGNVYLQLTS